MSDISRKESRSGFIKAVTALVWGLSPKGYRKMLWYKTDKFDVVRKQTHSSSKVRPMNERRRAVIGFKIPVASRVFIRVQEKTGRMSGETQCTRWSTACLKVGECEQVDQPKTWWNWVKHQRNGRWEDMPYKEKAARRVKGRKPIPFKRKERGP